MTGGVSGDPRPTAGRPDPPEAAAGAGAAAPSAIPPTYDLRREVALLDPGRLRFWHDGFDQLYLRDGDGDPVGPLRVQRAFPLSAAGAFLALKDAEGGEVGLVRHLDDLDEASRAAVERELEWTYFCSVITAVHGIETHYHVPHWDVDTDRGRRVFELRSSRRDVRVLPGGRVLVRDADGNLYEIPDLRRLDPASRATIEDYV